MTSAACFDCCTVDTLLYHLVVPHGPCMPTSHGTHTHSWLQEQAFTDKNQASSVSACCSQPHSVSRECICALLMTFHYCMVSTHASPVLDIFAGTAWCGWCALCCGWCCRCWVVHLGVPRWCQKRWSSAGASTSCWVDCSRRRPRQVVTWLLGCNGPVS